MNASPVHARVDEWVRERNLREDIFSYIPFNPMLIKKAMDELLYDVDRVKNFDAIAKFFDSDPSIGLNFYERARQICLREGRSDIEFRNIAHAISIISIPGSRELLNELISDEIIKKFRQLDIIELQALWKEIWAVAFSAREFARKNGALNMGKAYNCGLMANIGALVMGNLFRAEYFTHYAKTHGSDFDLYQLNSATRMASERNTFGMSHPELGFWILNECGLDGDIAECALHHESEDPSDVAGLFPSLVVQSDRIAKCLMMRDRFRMAFRDREERNANMDDFLKIRKIYERRITPGVENLLGDDTEAEDFIESIEIDLKQFQRDVNGTVSLVETEAFIGAFEELRTSRDVFLKELFNSIEKDQVCNHLPYPVSAMYNDMISADDPVVLASYATATIDLATRVLAATFMAVLLDQVKGDSKAFIAILRPIIAGLDKSNGSKPVHLSQMGALHVINGVAKHLSEGTVTKLKDFCRASFGDLREIIRIRNDSKSTARIRNPEDFLVKMSAFMKGWAELNYRYAVIRNMEWSPYAQKGKYDLDCVICMDPAPMKDKKVTRMKSDSPRATGETGIYVIIDGYWQSLPEFMVYKQGKDLVRQFFIADTIRLRGGNRLMVHLKSEDGAETALWPPVTEGEGK